MQTLKLVLLLALQLASLLAFDVKEEYFTLEIATSVDNLTSLANKEIRIENTTLTIDTQAARINNISTYTAFNIHDMTEGSHRLSVGAKSNGLIELLLCQRHNSTDLEAERQELYLFEELWATIKELIDQHPGFSLSVEDSYQCQGLLLGPEELSTVKKKLGSPLDAAFDYFTSRMPRKYIERVWEKRFNLEMAASEGHLVTLALYCYVPVEGNVTIKLDKMEELHLHLRNKQAVLPLSSSLTETDKRLIGSGSYPFATLQYSVEDPYLNGTGLHPKLSRRFAIHVSTEQIFTRVKSDTSCMFLVQETLDKGIYIDFDEVKNDENMIFHTFGVIDIEKPSSHSTQHTYFIEFDLNSSYIEADDTRNIIWINFTTPFHFRYHPAGAQDYTVVNVWESSQVYVGCKDYDHFSFKMDEYNGMESGYLDLLEAKLGRRFLALPNTGKNQSLITTYKVPIGLIADSPWVTYITLGVLAASCFALVIYIYKQKPVMVSKTKHD